MDSHAIEQATSQAPMELVRSQNYIGTAEELLEMFAQYRDVGLEYVVLSNASGMVGGTAEAEKRIPDFLRLAEGLAKL